MVQQINLLTPILLKPKRYFSALAMAQALGLLLVAGLIFWAWLSLQARQATADFMTAQARSAQEQQRLAQALIDLPRSLNSAQMTQQTTQQLAQLDQDNKQQQQLANALNGGLAPAGARHSDVLRVLAQSVPAGIWLSELRWQAGADSQHGSLMLSGATLSPAALQQWLQSLGRQALLAPLPLATVKLEKWAGATPPRFADEAGNAALPAAFQAPVQPPLRPGVPIWSFQVLSERSAANATGEPR